MDKKQINKLATLLGVPVWLVKESLGVPFEKCTVNSLNKAILALEDADIDSDEERAAFIRLEELILENLEKASAIDTLRELHAISHKFMRGSEIERKLLVAWDDKSLELLEKTNNIDRLIEICKNSPRFGKARKEAIRKITKKNFESLHNSE